MADLSDAFEIALRCHEAGQLQDAERIYRQILQADPHHADSLHYLGVIAYQVGKAQTAVDYIGRAVASDPHNHAAHARCGNRCIPAPSVGGSTTRSFSSR